MPPTNAPAASPGPSAYETAVLAHATIYLVGATWAFGGNADFVVPYLGAWGSLGMALTLAGFFPGDTPDRRGRLMRSLWPILAFNAVTLAACLTPGFRSIHSGPDLMYLPRAIPAWLPSAALPGLAAWTLWLFDGIYFSAFNLLFALKSRARLRFFFVAIVANAVVLAVFGTVQKLVHATGIYFGRVHSPQPYFFSTFIYDNHWGAFIILVIGVGWGLIWHYAGQADERGFFHSPAFAGTVALFFLFITVPLSGARICSALMLGFVLSAVARRLFRRTRGAGPASNRWAPPLIAGAALSLAAAVTWYIGNEVIVARAAKTVVQLREFQAMHGLGSRSQLYRDTWKMASDRLWFGWGMGSFPTTFQLYASQTYSRVDQLPIFYSDAHSDWLQAVAEHGLIGAALLAGCAVVPLLTLGAGAASSRLSRYGFAGCAVVLLYAWVEFPFGNYAVCLSWYLIFFAACRYGVLSASRLRTGPHASHAS